MKGSKKNIVLWTITFVAVLIIMFFMCCLDSPERELVKLIVPAAISAVWIWAFIKVNFD